MWRGKGLADGADKEAAIVSSLRLVACGALLRCCIATLPNVTRLSGARFRSFAPANHVPSGALALQISWLPILSHCHAPNFFHIRLKFIN